MKYADFIALTGLPNSTFSRWESRQLFSVRNKDRTINAAKFIAWAVAHVSIRPGSGEDDEGNAARLLRIKADRAELELSTMRGELQVEFEAKLERLLVPIIAARVAQPKQVALRLANKSAQEIEAELAAFNRAYVEELRAGHHGIPADIEARIQQALDGPA